MKSDNRDKRKDLVIGLDSSTTATKAIAFDRKGKAVAHAVQSIRYSSPQPNYFEQNPDEWWSSARKALREISGQVDPGRIAALAISNQRETFVPLDKKGKHLRPAILWLDERCKPEVESFAEKIGKNTIHRITGKPADYAPVVYRLAWMKRHEPELFRKIGMICDVHTYLVWKFTGSFRTSWASADPLGVLDIKKKKWSAEILNELGLIESQLPKVFRPGMALGRISEEASRATGLRNDTLIVAGGGDGQCAGSGVQALSPGRAYLNLGTAVVAGVYGSELKISKAFRTLNACSESGYYFECSLRAGTFAVDWFIRNILKVEPKQHPDIYKQLEDEARGIAPGSDGLLYLPYLCGVMNPFWDMDARGAFVGLSSSHNRGHMYRAILEGIAFEQFYALRAVEKIIGKNVHSLAAIGGGAASDLWLHILADVLGKDICLPETTEASALGAAIAASVGAGWFRTTGEAAKKMTGVKSVINPNKRNHRKYLQAFEVYKKLYPNIKKCRG
jgi:sugar (pentulose or hexulose) kinase